MLMTTKRRPAIRTLRGWAISLLQEAGAIPECEQHGWMQDHSDPHARERAVEAARHDPPPGSLRMLRWPRCGKSWTRSATPAPSVRPTGWPRGPARGWVLCARCQLSQRPSTRFTVTMASE